MKRLMQYPLTSVLALALLASLVWAATITTRSDIWEFKNGIKLCDGCTTLVGSTTAGDASIALPTNSVSALENNSATVVAQFCGELNENGTVHFGPIALTTPMVAIDAAGCDALTNATETSADARLFPNGTATMRPMRMTCITNGTMGAGETLTITLRASEADVEAAGADFACALAEAETTCAEDDHADAVYAATALWTMQGVMVSNNADADDASCLVWFNVN